MSYIKSDIVMHEDAIADHYRYQNLWKAVVLQAIIDIKSKSKIYRNSINRTKAIQWININRKDFIQVCQMADIDPQSVCDHKEEILSRQR